MNRKEKNCLNPECDEIIGYYENPKKLFCNTSCKNRFHYLSEKEKNHELYEFEKGLIINYNVAQNFIKQKIYKVDAKVAKALGFNKNVYMDLKQFMPSQKLYHYLRRIKDIFFRYDIEKDVIIFYIYN